MDLTPAQTQQRIAGLGLVSGGRQEGQELGTGHGIFGQREGPDGHDMLRPFRIEAARFMHRAAHQEFAAGNAHHGRTFGTFREFARHGGRRPHQQDDQKDGGDAQKHGHGPQVSRIGAGGKVFWL